MSSAKTSIEFADLIDIGHNTFRCSGFYLKNLFRSVQPDAPSCGSEYKGGSWVDVPVSIEQVRIERYLSQLALAGKNVLHVGVGSSVLARNIHRKCKLIDGLTVMQDEVMHARGLELSNYTVYLMNKYSDEISALPNRYHYLVDANPSSFTSKRCELEAMMARYVGLLVNGGMILMDGFGMHYHEPYAFAIHDDDLVGFERNLPLKFKKVNRAVRALVKIEG